MTNTTAIAKREHGHVCEWGIWKKKKKRKKANETGWRRKDTAIEEKRKEKIQYQQRWAQCAFCSIMKTINKLALSVQWIGKGNGVMCGGRQWQKGGSKCSIGCACVNVRFFLSLLAPILCCIVLMQCGWWPMFNVGTRTFIQVRNSASILRLSSTWERITLDRNAPVNVAICRHWHWHMANRYSYFLCAWWWPRQRKRMSFEHVCMQLNFNYISQMKRNSSRCVQISHIVSKLVVASSKYWTYHRIGSMVMVQISQISFYPGASFIIR